MFFLKRPYGLRDDGEDANFAPSGSRRSNSTRARLSYPLSLRPPLAYPPWEPQTVAPLGLADGACHMRNSVMLLHCWLKARVSVPNPKRPAVYSLPQCLGAKAKLRPKGCSYQHHPERTIVTSGADWLAVYCARNPCAGTSQPTLRARVSLTMSVAQPGPTPEPRLAAGSIWRQS